LWTTVLIGLVILLLFSELVRVSGSWQMGTHARLINVAGMQRTLSQRIATKAAALVSAREHNEQIAAATLSRQLEACTREFRSGHRALMNREAPVGLRGRNSLRSVRLFSLLRCQHDTLVSGSERILRSGEARQLDAAEQRRTVVMMGDAAEAMLPVLNDITAAYVTESRRELARNQRISCILTLLSLSVLIGTSVMLVRPIFRRSLKASSVTEWALADAERASAEASRLAAFARHSTNAMVRTDADRRITWVNDGFTRISGYRLDECLGKTPGELLQYEKTDPQVVHQIRAALNNHEVFRGRIRNRSKSGREYWLDLEIIPEIDSRGLLTGYIAIESDVTELVEANEEAVRARRQADEANRAKSEFLANMSHEIRTPMTAILGYTDLLDGDLANDPARSAEAVRTVQANANHLLTIINDILDVSKLEAGKLKLEIIDVNPIQIVEEMASLSRPQAINKNIEFHVRYETPIPVCVKSDPTRMRQVLLNLVNNAIKFTEAGKVTVLVAYDAPTQQLQFRITDTGIGMTPEQLAAVAEFSAFQQADMSTTRQFGGTGLGLHITSALVRMLGGNLDVTSTKGKGTTFTATLQTTCCESVELWVPGKPLPKNPVPDETHSSELAPGVLSLRGTRVLLVEDGPDNQRLISYYLEKAGADVEVCENGRQALDRFGAGTDREDPDVILMDMQMPELDGYQATKLLRRQGITLPIIALTAHAMQGDRRKCLDAGCNDYVTKPVDRTILLKACARHARSAAPSCEPDAVAN
jgi:PAS domain S-box-containing protein